MAGVFPAELLPAELCGACCMGSHPVRRRIFTPLVCACGAPFFSRNVFWDDVPPQQPTCSIGIPAEFVEEHGHRFGRSVVLVEEGGFGGHHVRVGGNRFVGFGFEWGEFARANGVRAGQLVVFTVLGMHRVLVQIYGAAESSAGTRNNVLELEPPPPLIPQAPGHGIGTQQQRSPPPPPPRVAPRPVESSSLDDSTSTSDAGETPGAVAGG